MALRANVVSTRTDLMPVVAPDVSWTVNDLPDLHGVATSRRRAMDAARAAVAAFLDVDPDAFDLEA